MKILSWILVFAGVALVIAGRIETIDLTEGRALIAGWGYWLLALVMFAVAYVASEL